MDGTKRGAFDFLKRLRGSGKPSETGGAKQLAMLRRIPRILRFIPGAAQDLRAYFLTLQYWLAGSDENIANLVRFLANRYASGPNASLRGKLKALAPIDYPEVGVYHPRAPRRIADTVDALPKASAEIRGVVGLLLMRSYILANNTAHYDAVIEALEARGLRTIPCFANGLDARPAVEAFFRRNGAPAIDAFVSLTGFSLVGGPAYNDSNSADRDAARPSMSLHRRPCARVPDDGTVGRLRSRAFARRSDDDGRHSRARWRDLANRVRRTVDRGGWRGDARHSSAPRAGRLRLADRVERLVRLRRRRIARSAKSPSFSSISRRTEALPARLLFCRSTPRSIAS